MLVVKLGGSVFQKKLTEVNPQIFDCINKLISLDQKIVIVTGGGKICRLFQNALKERGYNDIANLHWVGTRSVNLQSEFVRSLFPLQSTYPRLIDSLALLSDAVKQSQHYNYFACGGWEIGHSSDFDAVKVAVSFGISKILRISDIDYVYSDDPKKNPDAKKLEHVSWEDYFKIIGGEKDFDPGASYPIDPVAARLAKENQHQFYFTSLDKFVDSEGFVLDEFDGTVIG